MRGSGWVMGKEGWRERERDKGREGGVQNGEVRGRGVEGSGEGGQREEERGRGGLKGKGSDGGREKGGVMVGGRKVE